MAKSPRAALTRVAATVTARYYQTSGASDGFYLDGRISGRREHRAADITLDREDRGFFYSVFAHMAGGNPDDAAQGRVRKALDRILAEVRQPGHNIDAGINELAECAVSVAGRITLQHDGVRQPYFAGIMVKDSELAAVTMGGGCAYLYRGDVLYPLTSDEFQLEAIDFNGKPISGLDVYCAGSAGPVRYSNIAQLQLDDCIIVCNKDIMDALGQREVLRILFEAEDQTDAAGLIMTAASAKLPGVPLQFMIGFVETISTTEKTGRINFGRGQSEMAVAATAPRGGVNPPPPTAPVVPVGPADSTGYTLDESNDDLADEIENETVLTPGISGIKPPAGGSAPSDRVHREELYDEQDDYIDSDNSGRGRRIAFYVIIAIICIGCLFAIYNLLFNGRGEPTATTQPTSAVTTASATVTPESSQTGETSAVATTATTITASSSQTAAPGLPTTHTVVSGDTLYGIAVKYYGAGTQQYVDLIKQANGLTSDNLTIGQSLKIPAKS